MSTKGIKFKKGTGADDQLITTEGSGNLEIKAGDDGRVTLGDDKLKFPDSDGNANEVIKTDGAGNLTFAVPSASGGEANTAANVESGSGVEVGIWKYPKVNSELRFKSLKQGDNITLTAGDNEITIAASGNGNGSSTLDGLSDTQVTGSESGGEILIHDDGDSWDSKSVSGDIAISKEGVTTIQAGSVENSMLDSNAVTDAKVASNAAISVDKLSSKSVSITAGDGLTVTGGGTATLGGSAISLAVGVDDSTVEVNGSDKLQLKADGIKDTHIDFGTGSGQVSTADVTEHPTKLYYTDARVQTKLDAHTPNAHSHALDDMTVPDAPVDFSGENIKDVGRIDIKEGSEPGDGTLSSNTGAIYAKSDGKVYFKDNDNNTYDLTAGAGSGSGSVTSVDVDEGSTGLTTSGGPVTTSGTITLGGTLNIASGGTGEDTAQEAIDALTAVGDSGVSVGEVLTKASDGKAKWEAGGSGDVTGPNGGVADGNIALFDSTTGKVIKDSEKVIGDFATDDHTHTGAQITSGDIALTGEISAGEFTADIGQGADDGFGFDGTSKVTAGVQYEGNILRLNAGHSVLVNIDVGGGSTSDFAVKSGSTQLLKVDESGLATATTFSGSGASLTNIPVAQLDGPVAIDKGGTGEDTAQEAIDALTGVGDSGVGVGEVLTKASDGKAKWEAGGSALTVQESGGTGIQNVSTIKFDDDSSGFSVTETETGTVEITLGSHWKELEVQGADTLVPSGEENLAILKGDNITFSTDTTAATKELTIGTTGLADAVHYHTLSGLTDTTITNIQNTEILAYHAATSKFVNTSLPSDITGNASTATKLETARSFTTSGDVIITPTNFDGSGNFTAAATIQANAVDGSMVALGSDARGDVMYYNGTDYARLGAGTSGHFLKTQGAGADPIWAEGGGGGGSFDPDGAQVFNESGNDADFRIEGQGEANLFHLDASEKSIGIKTAPATGTALHVKGMTQLQGDTQFTMTAGNAFGGRISPDNAGIVSFKDGGGNKHLTIGSAGVIVNEDAGASFDFRVESENQTHMLFVDAESEKIGIKKDTPTTELDVAGTVKATYFQGDGSNLTNLPAGGTSLWTDGGTNTLVQSTIADNVGVGLATGDVDAAAKLTVAKQGISLEALATSDADPADTAGYAKVFAKVYADPGAPGWAFHCEDDYVNANGDDDCTPTNSGYPPYFEDTTPSGKFGDSCLDFVTQGSSSSLRALQLPNPNLGTGDFTVEFYQYFINNTWPYTGHLTGSRKVMGAGTVSGATSSNTTWRFEQSQYGWVQVYVGGTPYKFGHADTTADPRVHVYINTPWQGGEWLFAQWNHVALTRKSGTLNLWSNGHIHPKSHTGATGSMNSADPWIIGAYAGRATSGANKANCHLDEISITKGTAIYDNSSSTYDVPTLAVGAPFSDEVWAQGGGAATKISPHNTKGEWEFNSYDIQSKVRTIINTEEALRDLQALTGKTYIKKIQE
jgi:hypothetical protein